MGWSWAADLHGGRLECRPLTPDRFPDIEVIFGERGAARRCFCMYWRRPDGGFGDRRDNRDRFAAITEAGPPPGLVGYLDGEPVGWVQVGPRENFPTMQRSPVVRPIDHSEVWSVNCFVTRVGYRKRGIGTAMAAAAADYAASEGARIVEGYPYGGNSSAAGDYFTGTPAMFLDNDFVEVTRRKPTRPIVRLHV